MFIPHIFDILQSRGYTPQDNEPPLESWFDLPIGDATVRLVLTSDSAAVHMFGAHMVNEWSVPFSDSTPAAVILATLRAAENEAKASE